MKSVVIVIALIMLIPASIFPQVSGSELTIRWDETNETLWSDDGLPPFLAETDRALYLGRVRLQDIRHFPVFEARYLMQHNYNMTDHCDLRLATLVPLAGPNLFAKGVFVEQNPDGMKPSRTMGAYLMPAFDAVTLVAGLDCLHEDTVNEQVYSVRAKVKQGRFTILAGVSSQPNHFERYTTGGLIELPEQFIAGGLLGVWEDDVGYSFNIGRYNNRGDFAGAPSFSLNYLEVPRTYKWTNFRIMLGDVGAHYVRPTFDNRVFSGQLDIDVALMLSQLVPDNYRHFDSPLLFLRNDEYGKFALRVNYIETESQFRRFDVNFSVNPGLSFGPLQENRAVVSFERLHNPVFGWQKYRYHVNLATHLFGKIYSGITWSDDFLDYFSVALEFRIQSAI